MQGGEAVESYDLKDNLLQSLTNPKIEKTTDADFIHDFLNQMRFNNNG